MARLPTGTVTFLFTDIEGSTRLATALGRDWPAQLLKHHAIVRAAIAAHDGVEVKTEGDAFFAVFTRAADAMAMVVDAQKALNAAPWPDGAAIRVRMGLHAGIGELADDDYVGLDVHRAARVAAAANGGQVVLTEAVRGLVGSDLPAGARLREQGLHRLKDFPEPERLFDVVVDGLAADFPPLRSLGAGGGNLPAPHTSFVGREQELGRVAALLDTARLVTLTGPGGTGKTRLSIAVADQLRPRFADGAWFVALDAVRDPDLVMPAIATTLGVAQVGEQSPEAAVAERLASRQLFLVLDNLEQVMSAAPQIGRIVDGASAARVLCSSREPLRVRGEQEFPVPPLATDPAVRLFIDRARLVRPDFEPDTDALGAIQRICEAVDGLPLAIELAASRVRVLSAQQILARLADKLALLSSGGRDLPDRQRTLRGAIEWSYDLLSEDEGRFFARFAVFAGGAELDAIETVLRPGEELGLDALDATASLVEKSLLRQVDGPAGEARFRMLGTIRAYAAERLAAEPDADQVRERHAAWYVALAERLEPELAGRNPERFLDQLEVDNDDIRAAIAWSLAAGRPEPTLRIGAAIWRFWQHRWHLAEGRARLTEALAMPAAGADAVVRARAMTALGGVSYWQGDFKTADELYIEALAIYRQVGDRARIAHALYDLAFTRAILEHLDEAGDMQHEALALFDELGDEHGKVLVRESMGVLAARRGDYEGAERPMAAVIDHYRRTGARFKLGDSLTFGSAIALQNQDLSGAWHRLIEGIEIATEMGDASTRATGLQLGALAVFDSGDAVEAARLCGAYAALVDTGDPFLSPIETIGLPNPELKARAAIDAATFDAAFAEGRQLSLDDALVRILERGRSRLAQEVGG